MDWESIQNFTPPLVRSPPIQVNVICVVQSKTCICLFTTVQIFIALYRNLDLKPMTQFIVKVKVLCHRLALVYVENVNEPFGKVHCSLNIIIPYQSNYDLPHSDTTVQNDAA